MKRVFVFLALFAALSLLSGGMADAAVSEDDVLIWLDLSSCNVTDRSLSGIPVTNNGATSSVDDPGAIGGSCDFVYADADYLNFSSTHPEFSKGIGEDWTISMWVKFDDFTNNHHVINWRDSGSSPHTLLRTETDSRFRTFVQDSDTNLRDSDSSVLSTGTWYHIVIVTDHSGSTTTYVNNVSDGSSSVGFTGTTWDSDAARDWIIGHNYNIATDPHNGPIAQVVFIDRTIDTAEVSDLFADGDGITYDNYNFSPAGASNATLNAEDVYDSSSISNFTATWNGTNYTTTNGTIVIPVLTNSTSLWNLTYYSSEAGGYFSRFYEDINLSSTHTGSLHQLRVDANDSYTGNNLSRFYIFTDSSFEGEAVFKYPDEFSGNGEYGDLNRLFDGNFSTSTSPSSTGVTAIAYANYTIPATTSAAVWTVKDTIGTADLSIPAACLSSPLSVRVTSFSPSAGFPTSTWSCDNGTGWDELRSAQSSTVFDGMVTFTGDFISVNTTDGLIRTNLGDINGGGLYNITVRGDENGGYLLRTYNNWNSTQQLNASLHQSEITFNATNRVSGAAVTNFTANTTSNGGSATVADGVAMNLTAADNYTATFSKSGYYPSTVDFNTSALEQSTKTFSVYDHKLNLSITVGEGGATDQNFTADVYSLDYVFHEQASTTNGVLVFNLTDGNYTVYINDSIHALTAENVTLNSSVNFTNLVIDVRTSNTFNISFYNETSNELLDNVNMTWEIISDDEVRNGTTDNGTVLETLLTPGSYEIVYYYDADVQRRYYVTLTNQSAEDIRLYMIDADISSFYVAVVEDPSSAKCADQTVSLLRYYIDINAYRVVEMAKTDTNGQAVFRVRPNIIPYKFGFSGSCGDFTSQPSKLIDTSNTYTVTDAQSVLTSTYLDVTSALTYNNATRTFTYTWSDSTNIVEEGCLYVTRIAGGTRALENRSCSDGASGSILYTLSASNAANASYLARGTIHTTTEFSEVATNLLEVSFWDETVLKDVIPLAAVLILCSVILFGSFSAATVLVSTIVGIALIAWTGLAPLSWGTVTAWIILLGVSLYKLRR